MRKGKVEVIASVDEELGDGSFRTEFFECREHRRLCCVENTVLFNHVVRDHAETEEGIVRDPLVGILTLFGCEQFAIGDSIVAFLPLLRWRPPGECASASIDRYHQDAGSRDNGTGDGAATHLINASDE